jgi:hypothetical protein
MNFCRKYLVEGPQPLSQEDILQLPGRDALLRSALFEHLLLFDTLTIKVYGENIPLLLLLRLIGERGLDELLDQDAIRFVLWTPIWPNPVRRYEGRRFGAPAQNLTHQAFAALLPLASLAPAARRAPRCYLCLFRSAIVVSVLARLLRRRAPPESGP